MHVTLTYINIGYQSNTFARQVETGNLGYSLYVRTCKLQHITRDPYPLPFPGNPSYSHAPPLTTILAREVRAPRLAKFACFQDSHVAASEGGSRAHDYRKRDLVAARNLRVDSTPLQPHLLENGRLAIWGIQRACLHLNEAKGPRGERLPVAGTAFADD